jgi:hypothetical protein
MLRSYLYHHGILIYQSIYLLIYIFYIFLTALIKIALKVKALFYSF